MKLYPDTDWKVCPRHLKIEEMRLKMCLAATGGNVHEIYAPGGFTYRKIGS